MWGSEYVRAGTTGFNEVQGAVAGAAVEVLETMFFEIPLDEVSSGAPPHEGWGSVVHFSGSRAGGLQLRLDIPAAMRLAASFLGREDDATVNRAETDLVLMELANMLCGSALSRIEPHGAFRIEPPRTACEADEPGMEGWLVAPLESGRLAVHLSFTDGQ